MGRTADKGKAAAADEEAPVAAAVAAAPMEVDGSGAAPAAALAPSFGLSSRSDFKRAASVPLGFTCLMTNQGAHVLTLLLSLFNACSALAVLSAGYKTGWGGPLRGGPNSQWGWVNGPGGGARLAPSLGVPSAVFGAFTGAALILAALAALYLINATLLFFRGWYEAAAAAGGRRAGLPAFAVGTALLVWAGTFLGVSMRASKAAGGPLAAVAAMRGQWAFWLTVASGLAWLVKAHVLFRQPPVEAVTAWLASVAPAGGAAGGAGPGASVRPVLGSLPSGLRASLNRTPGVTVV